MADLFRSTFTNGVLDAGWTETDTKALLAAAGNGEGRRRCESTGTTPTWGDPGIARTTGISRAGLGAFAALVRLTSSGGEGPLVGLHSAAGLGGTNLSSVGAGVASGGSGGGANNYFLYVRGARRGGKRRSIDYLLAVVPRPGGGYYTAVAGGTFGTFPTAQLLYVERAGADATVYPHIAGRSSHWLVDMAVAIDTAGLPAAYTTRFGPSVAADEFTAANGTALSGRTTPYGGKTWTVVGSPSVQSNRAAVPAAARAWFNAGTPGSAWREYHVMVYPPATGGFSAEVIVRSDGTYTNSLILYYWTGEGKMVLYNQATDAVVAQTGAYGLVNGGTHDIRIVDTGTTLTCWLGDVNLFGTVTTSTMNANTYVGLASGEGTIAFDDVACWPLSVTLPSDLGPFPAPVVGSGTPLVTDPFTAANGTALATYNAAWSVHSGVWEVRSNQAQMTAAAVTGKASRSS